MKKALTFFTSVVLCVTMLAVFPAQVVASAAGNVKKYISEVKVGMGETSEQAAKELLAEGYTILSDDKGYADLNKDAGSASILKGGPNQKIVYLGYKTTGDASEAITDLAVMNMNGGYSFQEYEKLLNDHMDGKIKPFVERFVATLQEYRENLKKPQDSANYKRANYYKTLLNKLTDDDTGKPMGDLLVNPTKYELGDDAYNKLSDAEKKNHCDILTLLMQGNGQAVQLMETELTKASDPGSNTWLDRFKAKNPEKLAEEVKEENPGLTPSEINAELDKRYNDDAKRILEKWSTFNEILNNYDATLDKADEVIDAGNEEKEKVTLTENATKQEIEKAATVMYTAENEMVKGGTAAEDIVVHDYLEATKYNDGTMLEFFERPQSDFTGDEKIRELYPIVDALTAGQLAGLDFLSVKDMILMAVTDESGYKEVDLKDMQSASIYQDVNRDVYQKGNVALTSDALRAKASAQEKTETFRLSTLGYVLWGCTAAAGLAAAGSQIAKAIMKPSIVKEAEELRKSIAQYSQEYQKLRLEYNANRHNGVGVTSLDRDIVTSKGEIVRLEKSRLRELEIGGDLDAAEKQFSLKSKICNYLTAGFTVAMAILAGFSIYTTITEMMEYYKVDFAPIPKYMVDEVDITVTVRPDGTVVTDEEEKKDEKNKKVFSKNETAYYKAVPCNRTDGSSSVEKKNHEILQDRSDLNGDVGKQWLALYSVKYENGQPILADSLKVQTGKTDLPEGYSTGIHRFGDKAAFNLTSELFCYNDTPKGTFVFFKHDATAVKDLTASGSAFSGGFIALSAVLGLIVGSAITLLLSVSIRKRKTKQMT